MKIFIRGAAAALALSLVGVSGAEAQQNIDFNAQVSPACDSNDLTIQGIDALGQPVSYGWMVEVNCYGAIEGNSAGEQYGGQVEDFLNDVDNDGDENEELSGWSSYGPFSYDGTTDADAGGVGPFQDFDNVTSGELLFDNTLYGNFVIALKASDYFLLYRFASTDGLIGLSYDGLPNALSNASLYSGGGFSVPEPSTMLLLATGLIGMMFLARRREELA